MIPTAYLIPSQLTLALGLNPVLALVMIPTSLRETRGEIYFIHRLNPVLALVMIPTANVFMMHGIPAVVRLNPVLALVMIPT